MQNKLKVQNGIVLACAAGAAFCSLYANTNLLAKSSPSACVARERCYGVAKAGENDCATGQHACATKATSDHDAKEWIMLPKGSCHKIAGGVSD